MKPYINLIYLSKHKNRPLDEGMYLCKSFPTGTTTEKALAYVSEGCESWSTEFLRWEWEAWAWPGGYPIYYVTQDGGILSYQAANENLARTLDVGDDQFYIVDMDVNYEDPGLYCDHTNERIPSAYAEDAFEAGMTLDQYLEHEALQRGSGAHI